MLDITTFIIIAGAIGSAISGVAVIASWRRNRKPPEPPLKPSCLIFTTVEMQRPEGLPGHSRPPRDRLL